MNDDPRDANPLTTYQIGLALLTLLLITDLDGLDAVAVLLILTGVVVLRSRSPRPATAL